MISVILAERPYRLTVKDETEEQVFRQAARLVNDKMKEYGSTFAYRDKQDLLAMAAMQFAVECVRLQAASGNYLNIKKELDLIDQTLDDNLLDKSQNAL